jgi:hypothetical protein
MIDEASAIKIVEDHLASNLPPGWSHAVKGTKRHEHCWAIAVQPYNAEGAATYDLMGFEVDIISGALTQWT